MFLAFSFSTYYPAGGQGDFIGAFATRNAALAALAATPFEHHEIYDVASGLWEITK